MAAVMATASVVGIQTLICDPRSVDVEPEPQVSPMVKSMSIPPLTGGCTIIGRAQAEGGRCRVFNRPGRLRGPRAAQPKVSADQSQRTCAGTGYRSRHPDREPGDTGVLSRRPFRKRVSRRSAIRLPSPKYRHSTFISARRCMSRMLIACAASAVAVLSSTLIAAVRSWSSKLAIRPSICDIVVPWRFSVINLAKRT
jgi:hypothetical protein